MASVKYTGTWTDYSGYGQANRNFIAALTFAGVDVATELVTQVGERAEFGWLGGLCKDLEDRNIGYKVKVIHLTPDLYPKYMEDGKYNIGHLFWETDKLPQAWIDPCNKMSEIWTASEKQAEMIRNSGVRVPIYAFPQPINITDLGRQHSPYQIPAFDGFLFYSVFQWIDRKNPKALVTNFWKTFTGKTDVALLLKTYRVNYSDTEFGVIKSEVQQWKSELNLPHYPKIFLVNKLMSTKSLIRLHLTGNCYVTTTRGEGWCIPAVEAMLFGNPAIGIDQGGFADYMSKDIFLPSRTEQTEVTEVPWIPWYTSDQKWLEINPDDLSKNMLKVYKDQKKAKEMGARAQAFVKEQFNYITVGNLLKTRIEEIERFL